MASFTSYSSTQRVEPSNLNEKESKYWKNKDLHTLHDLNVGETTTPQA